MKFWPWALSHRKLILASWAMGFAWCLLVFALCRFVFTDVGVTVYLLATVIGCAVIGVSLGVQTAHRAIEARDRQE